MRQLLCPRCREPGPFVEGHGAAQCAECSLVFDPEPRKSPAQSASDKLARRLGEREAVQPANDAALSRELERSLRAGCLCALLRQSA